MNPIKLSGEPFSEKTSEILADYAAERGFRDPRWLTQKQADAAGGKAFTRRTCFNTQGSIAALSGVKSLELTRGCEIKRWIPIENESTGKINWLPSKKPLVYFNVEQCYNVVENWTNPADGGKIIHLSGTLTPLEELQARIDESESAAFDEMLVGLWDELDYDEKMEVLG